MRETFLRLEVVGEDASFVISLLGVRFVMISLLLSLQEADFGRGATITLQEILGPAHSRRPVTSPCP